MKFAYVTFVNNVTKYINLMKSTIKSAEVFSKYPIIVYCVDIPESATIFTSSDKCILRNISMPKELTSIFYLKPYVIIDSITQGLESGYYIESDDLLTPICDTICDYLVPLDKYPISPIHPTDVKISNEYMTKLNVFSKTQHYIHGHVLFKNTNLLFLKEWLEGCKISQGENWDESVLNCMYWKYGLKEHYLKINDPYYTIFNNNPSIISSVITLHGCKNPTEHSLILEKMIQIHTT